MTAAGNTVSISTDKIDSSGQSTGDIVEWFGTCTDIQEQKLAELERAVQVEIQSREKRYRMLAEVIPQVFIVNI